MDHLHAVQNLKQFNWSLGKSWLIGVFDWDLTLVNSSGSAVLYFDLELCDGIFPCALNLKGNAVGRVFRHNNSVISCVGSKGCSLLSIDSIEFHCDTVQNSDSLLQVEGSNILIVNSSFWSCSSASDGGTVRLTERSSACISFSKFRNSYSEGSGGAVSASNSILEIKSSEFHNCSSHEGGGALWLSAPICTSGVFDLEFSIESSLFIECNSKQSGGAILASLNSPTQDTPNANIEISDTTFLQCSAFDGGAVRFFGNRAVGLIRSSFFYGCTSLNSGGAISGSDHASLSLKDSFFDKNVAEGSGGGALHLKNALLFFYNISFINNSAIHGGGGVCLWESSIGPVLNSSCPPRTNGVISSCLANESDVNCSWATCESSIYQSLAPNASNWTEFRITLHSNVFQSFCGRNNTALYGPCISSDFKRLVVVREEKPVFAGLPFNLTVIKLDSYNQQIKSDSSSVLYAQVFGGSGLDNGVSPKLSGYRFAKLDDGSSAFALSISPIFSFVDSAYQVARIQSKVQIIIQGSDVQSGVLMTSSIIPISFQEGTFVCPPGYILSVDRQDGINSTGTCTYCQTGTYSINPLASSTLFVSTTPTCIDCPAGGDCNRGGAAVFFSIGTWVAARGVYHLVNCPPGYELINSTSGNARGIFSYSEQQCRACLGSQYIIESTDVCQDCPPGYRC